MNRLRTKLVLIFLAATLAPLALTVWVTTTLLEESVDTSSTVKLDGVSRLLNRTAREFYTRACADLKRQAEAGKIRAQRYTPIDRATWPDAIKAFAGGLEGDRFVRAGRDGNRLDYFVRHGHDIWSYSASLGDVGMEQIAREI